MVLGACGVTHNFCARRQSCRRPRETPPNSLVSWRFVWCTLQKTFLYKTVKNTVSGGELNNPVNSRFPASSLFHCVLCLYISSQLLHKIPQSPSPSGIQNVPAAAHSSGPLNGAAADAERWKQDYKHTGNVGKQNHCNRQDPVLREMLQHFEGMGYRSFEV